MGAFNYIYIYSVIIFLCFNQVVLNAAETIHGNSVINTNSSMKLPLVYSGSSRTLQQNENILRIVSYNVYCNFRGFPETKAKQYFATVDRCKFFTDTLRSLNTDIICMQEVYNPKLIKQLAENLDMNAAYTKGSKLSRANGGAILSSYPIKEFVTFVGATRKSGKPIFSRNFWRATLDMGSGVDLMVYGVHLWPDGIKEEITFVLDTMKKEKKEGVSQILAGDFNLHNEVKSDINILNQFKKAGLYDTISMVGKGENLTCVPGRLYSRVDYIFVERGYAPLVEKAGAVINRFTTSHAPGFVAGSDHLPINTIINTGKEIIIADDKTVEHNDYIFKIRGSVYRMKWIPAGSFNMGLNQGYYQAQPSHKVKLTHGLWMLEHEVTQKLWQSVMRNNPSYFNNNPNFPIEQVSWDDIQIFLKKLNKLSSSKHFRLPTEAEWEYACKGSKQSEAWYDKTSGGSPHQVKEKAPNIYGLYDMLGNMWEWCEDNYLDDAYLYHAVDDPVTYCRRTGQHVLKGASWLNERWPVNANYRFGRDDDYKHASISFRFVAVSIKNK